LTTSGSVNFSVTRNDIITDALELIGVYDPGNAPSSDDISSCARTLNMMIKAWQSENVGLWLNKEHILFQSYQGYSYDVGPSGDECCLESDFIKTEIATAAASGASTIVVDSITDMADGDVVGIELDDKSLQWTTINGTPAASTITLTATLTDAAAVDNHVYTYTTIANRPLDIIEARVRYPGGTETPIEILSREEYMALSDKDAIGVANQLFFDPQTTDVKIRIWPAASDVQYIIPFTGKMPIEDFDATANTPDFPQEWFMALSYNLAAMVAPKFGKKNIGNIGNLAIHLKENARTFDEEHTSLYFGVGGR